MKKTLRQFIFLLAIVFGTSQAWSQCANDNVLVAGNLTPPGVALSTTQNFQCGQYMLAYVVSGASYTISTCSNSSFDSQITVYWDATAAFVAYNDDFCGVLSSTTFTPSTCGLVRVLLDQYFCTTSTSALDVTMTMNTAGTNLPVLSPAPDISGCNGDVVNIGIASNGSGGTPPYTYNWAPAVNLAATNVPQTTATVTAAQSYTLVLTDANSCIAADTVNVSVFPNPVVNLGPDTTMCGGSVTLDAQNLGGAYLWSTGSGFQTINVNQTGNYSVTVIDGNGCSGNDDINVLIHAVPVVNLGNDTATCNSQLTLDAGSGFNTYSWSTGGSAQTEIITSTDTVAVDIVDVNGCSATDTVIVVLNPAPVVNLGADTAQCGGSVTLDAGNPGAIYFWSNSTSSQTTNASTTGTYTVLVITQAGCSNSDSINVTINIQPVADLGPDTSICASNITLDAGNPGSTYLWSNFATTQTTTVSGGTYNVTVTDPSGCTDSDTITVATNSSPIISAGSDVSICPNQSTTLTGTGGLFYQWSNNATGATITVTPTVTTTYYVTGFDINGCFGSDVVTVNVMPTSNAQFTASVTGATANFTNQSTNAITYSWNFGDASALDNGANPSHTYNANGTYTVTLTVTGPCGTDTYTQVVTITQVGLQDSDLANSLSLYPNPNDGQFTLSFEFSKSKDVTIEVLDVTGRIIYSEKATAISSYRKDLDLTSAESGMYQVRIITNDGVVTKKIVVQH